MRAIHLAHLDKTRPVVILTRESVRTHLPRVTVAPITSRRRGLRTEVAVGHANGIETASVVTCDELVTVPVEKLGERIGWLLPEQEPALAAAIIAAFDLAE